MQKTGMLGYPEYIEPLIDKSATTQLDKNDIFGTYQNIETDFAQGFISTHTLIPAILMLHAIRRELSYPNFAVAGKIGNTSLVELNNVWNSFEFKNLYDSGRKYSETKQQRMPQIPERFVQALGGWDKVIYTLVIAAGEFNIGTKVTTPLHQLDTLNAPDYMGAVLLSMILGHTARTQARIVSRGSLAQINSYDSTIERISPELDRQYFSDMILKPRKAKSPINLLPPPLAVLLGYGEYMYDAAKTIWRESNKKFNWEVAAAVMHPIFTSNTHTWTDLLDDFKKENKYYNPTKKQIYTWLAQEDMQTALKYHTAFCVYDTGDKNTEYASPYQRKIAGVSEDYMNRMAAFPHQTQQRTREQRTLRKKRVEEALRIAEIILQSHTFPVNAWSTREWI
ncbi:MAG: hypothetical protein ACOCXT_03575 [Candidatus Dojkabacteria bacterium]